MIKLEHVSKSYTAGIPALNDVSLDIEEGEFVSTVTNNEYEFSALNLHGNSIQGCVTFGILLRHIP